MKYRYIKYKINKKKDIKYIFLIRLIRLLLFMLKIIIINIFVNILVI